MYLQGYGCEFRTSIAILCHGLGYEPYLWWSRAFGNAQCRVASPPTSANIHSRKRGGKFTNKLRNSLSFNCPSWECAAPHYGVNSNDDRAFTAAFSYACFYVCLFWVYMCMWFEKNNSVDGDVVVQILFNSVAFLICLMNGFRFQLGAVKIL